MPTGLTERLIALVAAALVLFAAGWIVNGYRWNSKMQTYVAAQEAAARQAQEHARATEQTIRDVIDQERNKKDAEINIIRGQLDHALSELRSRAARPAALPAATGNIQTATGAQLFREDAEFLVREAARADEVVAELLACYTSYEAARAALRK